MRLAAALTIIVLAAQGNVLAGICVVGPQATRTIQEALAKTADCDTVLVQAGHYREGTITIASPVVLLGE